MVSKKNKDAENGLQVLAILGTIWTIGILYWTRNGDIAGMELNQLSLFCCNSVNVLFTLIFLASWRYTRMENRTKDYLEKHFVKNDSVTVEHMIEKFKLSQSSAIRAITAWAMETSVKGEYDIMTGVYSKEPKPDAEILPFCPNCGEKLTYDVDSDESWCGKCNKHTQSGE